MCPIYQRGQWFESMGIHFKAEASVHGDMRGGISKTCGMQTGHLSYC